MSRHLALAVIVLSPFAQACDNAVKDPHGAGPGGTGDVSPTGTGGATGGSPGHPGGSGGSSGGNSGMVGGGGGGGAGATVALPQCAGDRTDFYFSERPTTPTTIPWSGNGTLLLALRQRTTNGWMVAPAGSSADADSFELNDGGLLSGFKAGDQIKVISRQDCVAFSGCKTFSVFRDVAMDRLICGTFDHDPGMLPAFAEALGVPLSLQATCSFPPKTHCYVDEVQTLYRVLIQGDAPVRLERKSTGTAVVGGRSFAASLGEAGTATGAGWSSAGDCGTDAGPFWSPGALHFAIAAIAP